ncbi:MAG: ABC transporter ATP-binding protein [Gammaproteobacteria bacterium]|nr:ABC transporter ATP-binding protein [Gammaproteobacteria bacterium]
MQILIALENVHVRHHKHRLLDGVSMSLSAGETVGLLGTNGAGKSTTLKVACGLLQPCLGSIHRQDGISISFLPETPSLIESWTVKKFLHHISILNQIPQAQRGGRINEVIVSCDLNNIIDKPIKNLSKGNKQRVAIASAIMQKPDVLILDEPTSGLDPQQISQFRELILSIREHTAILLSSHIMHEVTTLCDRAIIIHDGKNMGEIKITGQQETILIEFFDTVSINNLQNISQWQSGEGNTHQFIVKSPNEQNNLIKEICNLNLKIKNISGIEKIVEKTFLELIGQTSDELMDTSNHE